MLSEDQRKLARLLKEAGYTHTAIGKTLGCYPNTVAHIFDREERQMAKKDSKLDPYVTYLNQRLQEYPLLTSAVLLKEIQDLGYTGRISILRERVRQLRPQPEVKPVVRYETQPGQQFQVDFGQGKTIIEGQVTIVKSFCMILGHSRHFFVCPVHDERLSTLLDCHNRAFAYFGGYAKEGLYDNMRTVFKALDRKKIFNTQFMDFADFYGFTVITHRPYHPQTKGKVERVVPFYRNNCLYGMSYFHWDHLERSTTQWLDEASQRVHSELKEVPWERFVKEERPCLLPLTGMYPLRRLEIRKVNKEGCIVFENQLYSVGEKYVGQMVNLEVLDGVLHIYQDNQHLHSKLLHQLQVQQGSLQEYQEMLK